MKDNIKEELDKAFILSEKVKRYIVHTKTRIEGEIIYEFWKKVGIKVLDNSYENYSTGLFDIYYSKTSFEVSYYLWHVLISNAGRIKQSHSYHEFKRDISKSHFLHDIFCRVEKAIEDKESKCEAVYLIKFNKSSEEQPNWVSFSNIDKTTFDEFVDYLYLLKRNINVLPYISGGMTVIPHDDLDRTYVVERIVDDIKKGISKTELLNKHFVHRWNHQNSYMNPFNLFFKEDVYEFIEENTKLSRNDVYRLVNKLPYCSCIDKDVFNDSEIYETFNSWLSNNQEHNPWIGTSRWEFIYMFRNEFKKFMHDKKHRVVVDGGWVLNDKQREIKLGLIDENGDLF